MPLSFPVRWSIERASSYFGIKYPNICSNTFHEIYRKLSFRGQVLDQVWEQVENEI